LDCYWSKKCFLYLRIVDNQNYLFCEVVKMWNRLHHYVSLVEMVKKIWNIQFGVWMEKLHLRKDAPTMELPRNTKNLFGCLGSSPRRRRFRQMSEVVRTSELQTNLKKDLSGSNLLDSDANYYRLGGNLKITSCKGFLLRPSLYIYWRIRAYWGIQHTIIKKPI
jgi:hypothetical protein